MEGQYLTLLLPIALLTLGIWSLEKRVNNLEKIIKEDDEDEEFYSEHTSLKLTPKIKKTYDKCFRKQK